MKLINKACGVYKVAKLLPMFDDFGTGAKLSCTAVETLLIH